MSPDDDRCAECGEHHGEGECSEDVRGETRDEDWDDSEDDSRESAS